jgi:hypothetical protein
MTSKERPSKRRRESDRRTSPPDAKLELVWKWVLRLAGMAAFVYILLNKGGQAPVAVYVLIGGLIGLPNVVSWQQVLNGREKAE